MVFHPSRPFPEIELATRAERHIPNQLVPEHDEVRLEAAKNLIRDLAPNANLRSLSATYNCMGLIFASRRVEIPTSELGRIFNEDNYSRLVDKYKLQVGDIVVYYRDTNGGRTEISIHVGIVSDINMLPNGEVDIIVLSKWGDGGEYFHRMEDVLDWYGSPQEFWTDRK